VQDVRPFGDRLHLRVRQASATLERLPQILAEKNIRLFHLKPVVPTLEDVFIELLESDRNGNHPIADH
jgi:hypothetical protein